MATNKYLSVIVYLLPCGYGLQGQEGLLVEVGFADDVLQSVGEVEVGYMQGLVVAAYLVDHFLGECYRWLLAFHDHEWLKLGVVDHYVAASR